MKRTARLKTARTWLKTYKGQNIVSGYRKHFGVDWVCAFKDLEILGIAIEPEYKNKVLNSAACAVATRRSRKLRRNEVFEYFDQDETFAYIAGYTEAGFAYGITWDEWERLDCDDSNKPDGGTIQTTDREPQNMPF
jgi:hypothetical protein